MNPYLKFDFHVLLEKRTDAREQVRHWLARSMSADAPTERMKAKGLKLAWQQQVTAINAAITHHIAAEAAETEALIN